MSDFLSLFSAGYSEARQKFIAVCEVAGVSVKSFANPCAGPGGEELATDVVWFGNPKALRVVVMISGTHGLEGLSGSACQSGWIDSGAYRDLPENVAVLMIHAINPYGVAWLQRETEDGVDLNRNYIDHAADYPEKPLYAQLHEALLCPQREGPLYEQAQARLASFHEEHGQIGYIQAFLGGQYDYPKGMSYGGKAPVWSNRTLTAILQQYCRAAKHLAVLDYHTGLGPYGHATMIVHDVEEGELAGRIRDWYGPSVWAVGSADRAAKVYIAETGKGCQNALPGALVTPVTVEYGTYDMATEIDAIQRDLWLRNHGDPNSPIGRAIKAELVEYFYPDDAHWREIVLCRSGQVMQQAIGGLAGNAD